EVFGQMGMSDFPSEKIYLGGPVSPSQVFYLCRSEDTLPELEKICDKVYMGMSWELLDNLMTRLNNPEKNIRFYLGYSGWGAGQLAGEMTQLSWLTSQACGEFIFQENEE
ncbi:MAG: YqgE/AlgH family protein, partial [Nitrospinota bacterium]|nr:YqgE/AlgH family protein [Nitrospinota bacterium]